MTGVGCGGLKGGDGNEGPERLAPPVGRGEGFRGVDGRDQPATTPRPEHDLEQTDGGDSGDPEGVASSSLDLIRDAEGEPRSSLHPLHDPYAWDGESPERCERVMFDLLNLATGLRVSGRCDIYRCAYCGPRKTLRLQQAAAFVKPERFVGLSQVPEEFTRARKQLNDLATRLRRKGYEWEWFWAIERNPEGTGYHVGAVQKGSFVPQAELQRMWGERIPHIQAVKRKGGGGASAYVVKGAVGYVTKGATGGLDDYYEHLLLNGGRGAHWSQGYFGRPIAEVVQAIREERYGESEGEWVKVPRT